MPDINHGALGAQVSEAPYPSRAMAWYATVVLAVLAWLAILDRFIISLLVDPIKRDLGLTDTEFGVLHGGAFALTFAVFGLLAGAFADRYNRRWTIFASVTIWSLATAACGMAQNFWQMLLARVGVGAGEAGLNPCAVSIISDLFPRDRITSAMAVYSIGTSLGSGCAYLFGGIIIGLVAQTPTLVWPVIGEIRSWQAVFFIVGIPGALFGLTIFTIPEPLRRGLRHVHQKGSLLRNTFSGYGELLTFMRQHWKFFLYSYLGFAVASISVVGNTVWYPAHMGRTFGWGAAKIGLVFGLTAMIAGLTSKLLCGYFVDRMYRHGYRDAQLRWYAGCLLVATPLGIIGLVSDNPIIFIAGIGLFTSLLASLPAVVSAGFSLVTPNELRGTSMAVFATVNAVIGSATGPILIATASDQLYGGGTSIGLGMATVMGICCPLAAFILSRAFRAMREAVVEQEAVGQQRAPTDGGRVPTLSTDH